MTTGSIVRLGEAVQRIDPVAPDTSCMDVRERFAADIRLGCIPIVDGTTPVGIVERGDFLLKLSMTYGNALWANRPIRRLMDTAPIVVEGSMAIHEINRVALDNDPTAPVRSIVVVDQGRYRGVCTPMSFLKLNAAALQSGYEDAVRARKQPEVTPATDLIGDAVRTCLPMGKELGVGIVTHIGVDPPALYVDPGRFLQIMLNLLSNAIKYTCAGDVVEVELEPAQDGGAVLQVRDHGPGMSAEVLERVLEPYWSDESAVLSTVRGTGLGLPITRQLAELHGCTLDIASTVGAGTTASITMPADLLVADASAGEVEQAVA